MELWSPVSEDCLYLNVFVPNKSPPPGGFATFFFVYGGSWIGGSSTIYDAMFDVKLTEDVIFVTINYRLGAFGFLASDTLRTTSPDGSTGNYGLQDQRAALQWWQQSASAFGGDPTKVMLVGESAGAGSTSCHLVAERSEGLFQRALMESGPFAPWTAMPYNISQLKYARLASIVGCASGLEFTAEEVLRISSDDAVLNCLKAQNMSVINDAEHSLSEGDARVDFAPTVDGVELTDLPEVLAAQGKIHDVPILLGSNRDEGTLFSQAPHDLNATGFLPYLEGKFGKSITDAMAPYYPLSDYPSPWWAETHIIGDGLLSCPSRRSARWIQNAPNRKNPVFLYFFQHELEVIAIFAPDKGCCHASELVFVFNFDVALWSDAERALSDQFVRYWTRFAMTGNPNGGGDPNWPAYDTSADVLMVLDVGSSLGPLANVKKTQCDAWDQTPIPSSLVFGH
jgi:carboxylesterase type B